MNKKKKRNERISHKGGSSNWKHLFCFVFDCVDCEHSSVARASHRIASAVGKEDEKSR